jgi:hypothetical protein
VLVVGRGVFEQDAAWRHLDARLDHLEDRAPAGDVGAPVDQSLLDVLEATERAEVVSLVVVKGRLVTHPPPNRIRVSVDLEVVRVVVQVDGKFLRHRSPPGRVAPSVY